jgi:RNA polymerase sigma-70 factor (ECF subfamily)
MHLDFDTVYERTRDRVWRLCVRLAPNRESAEDAFQEIFVLVFRYLSGFRGESSVDTWCYQIALNFLLRARRTLAAKARHVPSVDMAEPERSDPRHAEALAQALLALDETSRQVVNLVYLCQLSQQAAADQLGMPLGTVHSRLSRAKARLKEELIHHGY